MLSWRVLAVGTTIGALTGAAVGVTVGVGLGALFAPKAGAELREELGTKFSKGITAAKTKGMAMLEGTANLYSNLRGVVTRSEAA